MQKSRNLGVILTSAVLCFGGPNKDASVFIDYNAATDVVEACSNVTTAKMVAAVRISNASDLDGYSFQLDYDTTIFRLLECETPGSGTGDFFLESNGGKVGPLLKMEKSGSIEISASLVGNDRTQAPDGDGVLALITFQRLTNYACELKLSKVELIDSDLILDTKQEDR